LELKKITLASGLALFAFITAVFIACGTPQPKPAAPPAAAPQPPIEMIAVTGGTFRMGSPRGSGLMYERPDHPVTIKDFLLGKYEVTQAQYFDITGLRPSSCRTNPESPKSIEGWKTLPVEMVNWYAALVFCNKLSIKEKLNPVYRVNGSVNPDDWGEIPMVEANAPWDVEWISGANGYRLPTESEWEYAARGGAEAQNLKYAGSNDPKEVAWYYENSDTMSHTIGKKAPNELGLYDMSGNIMEWCWDWQGPYTAAEKDNPTGPSSGMYRVIRGGGWSYAVEYCLVPHRHNNLPYYRGVNLGFRVARTQ